MRFNAGITSFALAAIAFAPSVAFAEAAGEIRAAELVSAGPLRTKPARPIKHADYLLQPDGSYAGEMCGSIDVVVDVGGDDKDGLVCTRLVGNESECALRIKASSTLAIMPEFIDGLPPQPPGSETYFEITVQANKVIHIDSATASLVLADVETQALALIHAQLVAAARDVAVNGYRAWPKGYFQKTALETYRVDDPIVSFGGGKVPPAKLNAAGQTISAEMNVRAGQFNSGIVEFNDKILGTSWAAALSADWIKARGLDAALVKQTGGDRAAALTGLGKALVGPDARK